MLSGARVIPTQSLLQPLAKDSSLWLKSQHPFFSRVWGQQEVGDKGTMLVGKRPCVYPSSKERSW